ncbi:acyltransferase [Martelella alba]|uniref:Acyltransferase n=2 Tax=Martelella alba TaxID=2590451 RepID=A0ABY2SN05_9HYPH|nr:acyltransferase [Martelella alba]
MASDNKNTRINWIDNIRAVACLMVIVIHTTTYYVTHGFEIGRENWLIANILNSASRVSVPLFFMISGFLFFGERCAEKKHFTRIVACIVFYSAIALIYMHFMTEISVGDALNNLFQKPIFFHLWFFYALIIIYLLSPLLSIKPVSGRYLLVLSLLLGVFANPNTDTISVGDINVLPWNLYVNGDAFYYVLYAVLGRAIGVMASRGRWLTWGMAAFFLISVCLIALGTKQRLITNGGYSETYYMYCGPLVFIAAVSVFILIKQLGSRSCWLFQKISRHSLAIYGFHAFFINVARIHNWDFKNMPLLDIPVVFIMTVLLSYAAATALGKADRRGWVS